MFYNETNSTEATRSIRNRLHNGRYVSMAHSYSDDQILTLQAIILGQSEVEKRQAVERFITRCVVTALIDAGYSLTVYDDEDSTLKHSKDVDQIVNESTTTIEDRIVGINAVADVGWVDLNHGCGWYMMQDYSTNLKDVLKPVLDLLREIGP